MHCTFLSSKRCLRSNGLLVAAHRRRCATRSCLFARSLVRLHPLPTDARWQATVCRPPDAHITQHHNTAQNTHTHTHTWARYWQKVLHSAIGESQCNLQCNFCTTTSSLEFARRGRGCGKSAFDEHSSQFSIGGRV